VTNVETVITDVEIVIVYDGICLCCERDVKLYKRESKCNV